MSSSARGKRIITSHDGKVRLELQNNRVVSTDGTDDRFIIGTRPDGSRGPYLSQPGFDVKDASDDQLIINAGQNVFKIVHSGTLSNTKPANSLFNTVTYSHGLGFTPAIVAYMFDGSVYFGLPYITSFLSGTGAGLINESDSYSVSSTLVSFGIHTPDLSWASTTNPQYSSSVTRTMKFYLLQETAN